MSSKLPHSGAEIVDESLILKVVTLCFNSISLAAEVCHISMAVFVWLISFEITNIFCINIIFENPVSRVSPDDRDPLLGTSEGSRYGLRALPIPDFEDKGSIQLPENVSLIVNFDDSFILVTFCFRSFEDNAYKIR